MVKKIILGVCIAAVIGMFTTSFFLPSRVPIDQLFLTKITATSMVTGFFTGIYAYLSKSKLQVFLVSILMGMAIFYLKYIITGHDFDPLTMGAFTGALLGAIFALIRKVETSIRIMRRLRRHRNSGFNKYGY